MPTLEHHRIIGVSAEALRLGHAISVFLDLKNDLRVSHARIGIGAQCYKFVKQNTKRPDVRFNGVGTQAGIGIHCEHLRRCPLDRKLVAFVLRQFKLVVGV